ncbi:hypothetical protein [Spirosoma validum]|uniref:Uncharacterized protein n=1 Tax=Spirosoma validum TaxID=2771355 RepID=A0A927B9J2_9BACT|nr:hypothetical protein [Spirosoma validum]MBD2757753.1 hypothetical protein [Spirosoma validum]
MTIKTKRILDLSALFSIIVIYLIACTGNSFNVRSASQRHEFKVKQTHFQLSIDAPVVAEITGVLDGKAVVFMPNGPQDSTGVPVWDNSYSVVKLSKGRVSKKVYIGEMSGDFKLIYQPTTAKNGLLNIRIDY